MPRALTSYERIYRAVRRIPRGRVATYGDVAAMAGLPGRARQVGYALHALPTGSPVPWHRVINAAGRISLSPATGGLEQRLRLLAESVRVDQGGRVKLTEFRVSSRRRG
jgi:methylated-DNA-protein-cysteine methyltransferase related protein